MVQGYYTLDEAARMLGMDPEKLNVMAQRREIRAFADRGTWRFRTQDVDEMARRLGMGSNPELQLGEAERAKPVTPSPKPRSGPKGATPTPTPRSGPKADEGVLDFSAGRGRDSGVVEHDIVIESPSHQKPGRGGSPSPKPGSDSDVHLVFDQGGEFSVVSDSDVRLEDANKPGSKGGPKKSTPPAGDGGPGSGSRKKTMMQPPSSRAIDSGVRLVPMEEANTLPIGQQPPSSGTDSDIRLVEDAGPPSRSQAGRAEVDLSQTTEDINLDEELKKAEALARGKKPRSKAKPKTDVKKTDSTGEVALDVGEGNVEMSPAPRSGALKADPNDRTDELQLDVADEELAIGELGDSGKKVGTNVAGINLHSPPASGANVEKHDASSDSLEFELSLEPDGTPRPIEQAPGMESSSEFELTLDEGPGLAPLDEAKAESGIFDTDFEMPAIEGEAQEGSSDTELESSDFDLSLGEEESGSQVVALEGEEADESSATVSYQKGRAAPDEGVETEEEVDELLEEEELEDIGEDEELVPRRAPAVAAAAPTEWGALPVALMAPCVIVMFLLGIMSFELLHNMWGYAQPSKPAGPLVKYLAGLTNDPLPE